MLDVANLTVRFDGVAALDDVPLTVADGELVVILGPSGCGKSTLLRAVAGLQPIDDGQILLDDADLAGVAPHKRGIGLMFQDHALFPHRDVGANVQFGLRMAGLAADVRATRVAEMLDLVGLSGFERRQVATLSGGEAQRVALARALAPRPHLLLLDEPLGSLDRSLRDRLVDEIPVLLRDLGIAAVHVTHDHDEAFAVADRVVVMGPASVRRSGTPTEVWSDPVTEEVARFLGHRNIVDRARGRAVVLADAATIDARGELEVTVVRVRLHRGRHQVTVRRADQTELVFELPTPPAVDEIVRLRLDPARIIPLHPNPRVL